MSQLHTCRGWLIDLFRWNLQYLSRLDEVGIREVVRFNDCVYSDAELFCDF